MYTRGYSPGMAGKDASLLARRNFLPKPYSIGKLAQFVRECLDSTAKQNEMGGGFFKTSETSQPKLALLEA